MIDDGLVFVTGQQEFRRRNKIVAGFTVKLAKQEAKVVRAVGLILEVCKKLK